MRKDQSVLDIRSLTNPELLKQTEDLVKEEREIGIAILHRLREISRRRLHCQAGFSSLFTYCVQHLRYPEASAYRLIQTMKAVKEFPEIELKIQEGELSISSVSQVQSFFNSQQRQNGVTVSPEQKKELFAAVEGKTRKESEQVLASLFPQNPLPKKKEQERPLNPKETQITFVADTDLMAKLKQIRELLNGGAFLTYPELILKMAELSLKKLNPVKRPSPVPISSRSKQPKIQPQPSKAVSEDSVKTTHSRYIPASVRRETWTRAGGQCCFVSKTTGKRCMEKNSLEFEHIKPFGLGGDNSINNIELKCKSHNLYAAIASYGSYMGNYLREP